MTFLKNLSITVIDKRFKFGAILVFTLIQLSNSLDGGLVILQSRKKIKNEKIASLPTSDCGICHIPRISELVISYKSNSFVVNIYFPAILELLPTLTPSVQ